MKKKTSIVAIFIFILIVMFFLFPKSCQQGEGGPMGRAAAVNTNGDEKI